jgi:transcriptional regulator with XRE-family HTH domain
MAKDTDRAALHRLGARIRALRAACELTQEMLADRVDRSQKYLSELERGQRSPSWETLVAIAHHGFEIKLASLMFGVDEDVGDKAQELSDVLADRPKEAHHDLLHAVELMLRAGTIKVARQRAPVATAQEAPVTRGSVSRARVAAVRAQAATTAPRSPKAAAARRRGRRA